MPVSVEVDHPESSRCKPRRFRSGPAARPGSVTGQAGTNREGIHTAEPVDPKPRNAIWRARSSHSGAFFRLRWRWRAMGGREMEMEGGSPDRITAVCTVDRPTRFRRVEPESQ